MTNASVAITGAIIRTAQAPANITAASSISLTAARIATGFERNALKEAPMVDTFLWLAGMMLLLLWGLECMVDRDARL